MRALCGATEVGMSVTGQGSTVSGLEFLCRRKLEVLQIEYLALQQCGEKAAFCEAIAVDVGESRHRLLQDGGQLVVGNVSVVLIQSVLDGAVWRHVIGGFEAERFGKVLARHGRFFTTISF